MTDYPSYSVGKYLVEPTVLPGNQFPVWRIREEDGYGLFAEPGVGCWCLYERDTDEYWPIRHWCYDGPGFFTLMKLMVTAVDWDWSPRCETRPVGWNRDVNTDERYDPEHWGPESEWAVDAIKRVWPEAFAPPGPSPSVHFLARHLPSLGDE